MPPLIAQIEFVPEDVPRVVALIVAIAQGAYSFAPATFGVIWEFAPRAATWFLAPRRTSILLRRFCKDSQYAHFWQAAAGVHGSRPKDSGNPVGTVWINLFAEGYGIHGTPSPGKVSKAVSHGCVRLTNWDAERVASQVSKGTPVDFIDAPRS